MGTEGAGKKWRWIGLAAALLALVPLVPSMWRRYRPLNEMERRLVGDWIDAKEGDDLTAFHFRADRTWTATRFLPNPSRPGFRVQVGNHAPGSTTWDVSGVTLTQRWQPEISVADFENVVVSLSGILSGGPQAVGDLEFDGPDRMSIAGDVYVRFDERSPEVWRMADSKAAAVPAKAIEKGPTATGEEVSGPAP